MQLSDHAMELRRRLKEKHEVNLAHYEIAYPQDLSHEPGLLALFEAMPEPVSQAALTAFYTTHSDIDYNKQLRHLASSGWDIRSGNTRFTQGERNESIGRDELQLAQVVAPNPVWLKDARLKRIGNIPNLTWTEKLRIYREHGCAVCGQKFRQYDRGHLDPARGFVDDNVVPMCSPCNNWAQDRVTFKLDGLIARPVLG